MLARVKATEASATLEDALIEAKLAWKELRGPMHLCTVYWTHVFLLYFGDSPYGDNDPRWDTLFKEGMPALRVIEGRETKKDLEARQKSGT